MFLNKMWKLKLIAFKWININDANRKRRQFSLNCPPTSCLLSRKQRKFYSIFSCNFLIYCVLFHQRFLTEKITYFGQRLQFHYQDICQYVSVIGTGYPSINIHLTLLFCSSKLFITAVKHVFFEAVIIVFYKSMKHTRNKRER